MLGNHVGRVIWRSVKLPTHLNTDNSLSKMFYLWKVKVDFFFHELSLLREFLAARILSMTKRKNDEKVFCSIGKNGPALTWFYGLSIRTLI